MSTKTETIFVLCKKGDHTGMLSESFSDRQWILDTTSDIKNAFIFSNANNAVRMMENYAGLTKEYDVVEVLVTTTVEFKKDPNYCCVCDQSPCNCQLETN